MRYIVFIVFIGFIAFSSCDGRERKYKTNIEVLKEQKLLDSFSENINYHPIEYSETQTDTVLNNGYVIKTRTYTDMEHSVLQQKNKDSIIYKHYFRKLISEVQITKDSKEVFKNKIDEAFLSQFDIIKNLDLKLSIISAGLNQSSVLKKDSIIITCMVYMPKVNKLNLFDLLIDKSGKYKLEKTST